MKKNLAGKALLTVSAIALGMLSSTALANGKHHGSHDNSFRLIFPLSGIPGYTAEEMVQECGGRYEHARANIWFKQRDGRTHVYISVKHAVPYTYFTIWLRLASGSPLTSPPITALANPDDTDHLGSLTPSSALSDAAKAIGIQGDDGTGGVGVANGFWTDRWGNGVFHAKLDYPMVKGAFQFQEYHESLPRVAIGDSPFLLRIASHCVDQKAHGLVPGKHEMFFDWN